MQETLKYIFIAISLSVFCLGFMSFEANGESKIEADSSENYQRLLDRYFANDTLLSHKEYKRLYYGYEKHPGYKPGKNKMEEARFFTAITKRDFEKAIAIGEQLHRTVPFRMDIMFALYICYSELGKFDKAAIYQETFQQLLNIVMESGDGSSEQKAIVLLYMEDAPRVLDVMNVVATDRKIRGNKYLVYTLETPNEINAKKIFFNVQKPLGYYPPEEG